MRNQSHQMAPLPFTDLQFRAGSARDQERGLLGFVSVTLGPLRLDGIGVRRTLDGRLTLSYPKRPDGHGHLHPIIRPLDDAARRDIEHQVFQALGLEEEAAP